MIITVIHKQTKVVLEEHLINIKDTTVSMRWDDQNKQIQETLIVICDQIKKLNTENNEKNN